MAIIVRVRNCGDATGLSEVGHPLRHAVFEILLRLEILGCRVAARSQSAVLNLADQSSFLKMSERTPNSVLATSSLVLRRLPWPSPRAHPPVPQPPEAVLEERAVIRITRLLEVAFTTASRYSPWQKGGLMYEASIGGQKFSYRPVGGQ